MVTEMKDKPIYCRDCNSRDTWERAQDLDVTDSDTGKVLWEGWRCGVCGATTIIRGQSNER